MVYCRFHFKVTKLPTSQGRHQIPIDVAYNIAIPYIKWNKINMDSLLMFRDLAGNMN